MKFREVIKIIKEDGWYHARLACIADMRQRGYRIPSPKTKVFKIETAHY